MGKNSTKRRILTVAKILFEETDENNPISMSELLECLESKGIRCERKAVYGDIHAIQRTLFPVTYTRKGWFNPSEKGDYE